MSPAKRARRITRTYIAMSALDYFADMTLVVTSVLLLQARGLSTAAVFATVAAVWLIEGLLEIPTGVAADIFGRRNAVLVSLALRAVGYAALFFSDRADVAVVGTLVAAVGGTFLSGALEAWAVDELRAVGSVEMDRLFARSRVAENIGLVLGTMAGAALGMKNLAVPQLAAGMSSLIGVFVVGLWMNETMRGREGAARSLRRASMGVWTAAREIGAGTGRLVRGDKILTSLMVGTALLLTVRGIPGVQWSAHFEGIASKNLLVLGLIRCVSALVEIPLLFLLLRIQKQTPSARPSVIVCAALAGAALLAISGMARSPLLAGVSYVGFAVAFGLCMPGIRAAMNERIGDTHRATALSCAAFFGNSFTGVGLLVVGAHVTSLGGVATSWPLAALVFAVVGVLVGLLARRSDETQQPTVVLDVTTSAAE